MEHTFYGTMVIISSLSGSITAKSHNAMAIKPEMKTERVDGFGKNPQIINYLSGDWRIDWIVSKR